MKKFIKIVLMFLIGTGTLKAQKYDVCATYDTTRTLQGMKAVFSKVGPYYDNLRAMHVEALNEILQTSAYPEVRAMKLTANNLGWAIDSSVTLHHSYVNQSEHYNASRITGTNTIVWTELLGLPSDYAEFRYRDVRGVWSKIACINAQKDKKQQFNISSVPTYTPPPTTTYVPVPPPPVPQPQPQYVAQTSYYTPLRPNCMNWKMVEDYYAVQHSPLPTSMNDRVGTFSGPWGNNYMNPCTCHGSYQCPQTTMMIANQFAPQQPPPPPQQPQGRVFITVLLDGRLSFNNGNGGGQLPTNGGWNPVGPQIGNNWTPTGPRIIWTPTGPIVL